MKCGVRSALYVVGGDWSGTLIRRATDDELPTTIRDPTVYFSVSRFTFQKERPRMRTFLTLGLAAVATLSVAVAGAEDLKSGLAVGKFVGAFDVEKVAGIEDGVKPGQTLCYR
jgi:hypothetical protein